MKKRILKTATYCLIGTLAFTSFPLKTYAAEITMVQGEKTLGMFDFNVPIMISGLDNILTKKDELNNFAIGEEADELAKTVDKRIATENTTTDTITNKSSSKRDSIVQYALQFVGNPYVWGGTSLTQGTDCSGFTQSVFRDNGISIPRTSRTQANGGKVVSLSNIQPGDLIFYTSDGTINHVALYIGNGKVVGASNPASGIKISNYTYRQPYKVVSYIS